VTDPETPESPASEPAGPTVEPIVARSPESRPSPIRPIGFLLTIAVAAAVIVVLIIRGAPTTGGDIMAKGQPVPEFSGTTLDGQPFDLATERGKPVLVNFWGPSCIPCREEFPLLAAKAAEHAADGLVIVGVLVDDPVDPARDFTAKYGGTWPTVIDPEAAIKKAYLVVGRPQTYFVDRAGILRSIQLGPLTDADFERQFALISGGG
jgi:cytochrome c biogenesis protein CcmG/thiol:disulfide interchange protein DsbE